MNTRYVSHALKLSMGMALGATACIPSSAQSAQPQPQSKTSATKPAAAKTDALAKPWKPKLLSDGQPDVQGIWTTTYYGMGCLTNPTNGDVNCVPPPGPRPPVGTANAGGPPPADASGHVLGQRGNGNPPSIVDGQPAPGGRGGGQRGAGGGQGGGGGYGDIDPQQRCWPLGAVRQFTWHDVIFEQFPGYILQIFEGGEVYRIIYLDNRPHISNDLKLWMGDARGHWEGTTLVVDTTSNNAKGRLSRAGDFSSDNVHHVERYIFTDADHFKYEATFDDPSVYTRPWTFGFDEHRGSFGGDGGVAADGPPTAESQAKYEMWEEACHEGLIPGGNTVPSLPPIN